MHPGRAIKRHQFDGPAFDARRGSAQAQKPFAGLPKGSVSLPIDFNWEDRAS